ncbi:hypothetical protein L6R29_23840 [Myxococcota bacterium]|nr:hypothetical protein [Myxococcota bacterium]
MPKDQRIEPLATISADAVRWMIREQPTHRASCRHAPRPCPHLLCRFHTYFQSAPTQASASTQTPASAPLTNTLALAQNNNECWEAPSCRLDALEQEAQQKGQPIEPDHPVDIHPHLTEAALQILAAPTQDN